MSKSLRVLIVEDSEADTQLLLRELRQADYQPVFERVDTPAGMTAALGRANWDLVVADFSMPQFNALAALELSKAHGPDLPFIIVSGTIGEELAVKAMQNGAQDYIMKDDLRRLVPAIERELRQAANGRERKRVEEELRKNQEQFRVAREIQQRLLPKASPELWPFDIAGISCPAEATGGDYFDYLHMADGCLGIVVADVSGHGVGPALLMAETRAYLRSAAMNATDVGEILTRTHHALGSDVDPERFVTLLLAKLDPRSQSLIYASAGHPTGYVLNAAGEVKAFLKRTGVALGGPSTAPYVPGPSIRLAPGDIVLLLTDGVEEATSAQNEFFGVNRIVEVVRNCAGQTAREIVRALDNSVQAFSQNQPQLDDMTVAVVKVKEPEPIRPGEWPGWRLIASTATAHGLTRSNLPLIHEPAQPGTFDRIVIGPDPARKGFVDPLPEPAEALDRASIQPLHARGVLSPRLCAEPGKAAKCILQVEDDENDVFMLSMAFEQAGISSRLNVVTDGDMAIEYLSGSGRFRDRQTYPWPCAVLLDLKLPKRNGLEVLEWIRRQPMLKRLVVLIFSSSALPRDVERAYDLGANAYVQKPCDPEQLREFVRLLDRWWLGHNHFAPIVETFRPEILGPEK